ncbi:S-layer homology domain-containing protein [Tepidibacter hydrothermalis]|uniref:S-layer homology domain-containing protein n=1 Tax=Tepidibacter hydrothermalis TaxID=3036126 RepID=A0ABY8EI94_9FIRM|nr:S-layer homology domain-containing protein [Tepidibacter hydrothermalis]WFD10513.1 S-layer homology domain-containing protein [Tepidibacter hydrothermalis]
MKNTKKVLSVALAGALAFGSMGSAFAMDAKLTEGIDNQDVVKAVEKLNALDIVKGMEDGKYHAEGELTRAQFAKMLVESLGLGYTAEINSTKPEFKDVDASCEWAWGYINTAKQQGILSGYPDGTFKPQAKVSYPEALTMLVRALGYQDSFVKGSWPGNYISKATDLDITDDIKIEGTSVNRGSAAILVSNTLDAAVIKQDTFGDDNNWKEVDGKIIKGTKLTLLEDKRNIVKYEDVQVTGTPNVDTGVKKDQIKLSKKGDNLGNFDVDAEKVNVSNLLGEGLNVYYDVNEKEVVYVEKADKEFATYYDMIDETETLNKDEFYLIKADKSFNIDDENVKYYIDNKSVGQSDFEKEAKKGNLYVKAVADEKGNIAVVEAQRFETKNGVIVVKADKDSVTYFDSTESTKEFKAKDYDKVSVVDNTGKAMKLEDIKENDVMYINDKNLKGNDLKEAASSDEVAQIVVVRDVVKGKGQSWEATEFEIDGKDYDVVKNATTVSTDKNKNVETYTSSKGENMLNDITAVDGEVIALMDAKGDIRHITTDVKSTSDDMYGIITGVDKRYNDVSVKVLNKEGKEVEYTLDIDGDELYGFTAESQITHETVSGEADGLYDFVKYTVNKDGKIDSLVRLGNVAKANPKTTSAAITTPKNVKGQDSEVTADMALAKGDISKSSIKFDGKGSYAVEEDVVVFDYTEGYTSAETAINDASDAEIVKWADIVDKTATGAKAIYALDDNNVIQAVVFIDGFESLEDDGIGGYIKAVKVKDGDKYLDVILEGSDKVERIELEGTYSTSAFEALSQTAQIFKKTSSGKIKIDTDTNYSEFTGKVIKVDGKYVTVKNLSNTEHTYKVDDTIYYEKDDDRTYSDLDENDYVTVIAKNADAKAVKLYDTDMKKSGAEATKFIGEAGGTRDAWLALNGETNSGTPGEAEGTVSYINTTDNEIQIGNDVYPVVGAAKVVLGQLNHVFTGGLPTTGNAISLDLVLNNGEVVGFENIVITADATKLASAVAVTGVDTVKLSANYGSNLSLAQLVDIDFGSHKITGNVSVNTSESGTMTLTGSANPSITRNLTVDAPNATINNNVVVGRTITVTDVAAGTWNQNAKATTLVVSDDDATVNINGEVTTLNITNTSKVTISSSAKVTTANISGAAEIVGANKIETADVTVAGVKLDSAPKSLDSHGNDVKIGGSDVTNETLKLQAATAKVVLAEAEIATLKAAKDEDLTKASKIAALQEAIDAAKTVDTAADTAVADLDQDAKATKDLVARLAVVQKAIGDAQTAKDDAQDAYDKAQTDAADKAAVEAEVAKYATTATIAKSVGAGDTITTDVIKTTSPVNDQVTVKVAKGTDAEGYLTVEADGAIKLTKQAAADATENTATVKITLKKGETEKVVTVTVTIEKQTA